MRPQQRQGSSSGSSPVVHPQRSPPLVPSTNSRSPPLHPVGMGGGGGALGGGGGVGNSTPNGLQPSTMSAGQFRPPAPFSLGESAVNSVPPSSDKTGRRVDPTKFKTDLCRNWEQTGCCNFKGCTFAHGHDELRPVPRPQGGAPQPASPSAYVDHLSQLLIGEVQKEVHIHHDHQEANRQLEAQLREEQSQRQAYAHRITILEQRHEELVAQGREKDKILNGLRRQVQLPAMAPGALAEDFDTSAVIASLQSPPK